MATIEEAKTALAERNRAKKMYDAADRNLHEAVKSLRSQGVAVPEIAEALLGSRDRRQFIYELGWRHEKSKS